MPFNNSPIYLVRDTFLICGRQKRAFSSFVHLKNGSPAKCCSHNTLESIKSVEEVQKMKFNEI